MNAVSTPRTPSGYSDVLTLFRWFALALWGALVLLGPTAQAQTLTTLYSFKGNPDGGLPFAGVVQDESGNLYGTTPYGGSDNGVVYEVTPSEVETVLYSFGYVTGADPFSPILRDNEGNIFGTTAWGGTSGQGTIFVIDTSGKETVVHNFAGGTTDGCEPGGLVMDKSGSLYGTTSDCGANKYGTVFKLTRKGAYSVLHSFTGTDGAYPSLTTPIFDRSGNLYGVAYGGGSADAGVVYKLTTAGIQVLHSFTGTTDSCNPYGIPVIDEAGNLYGTTSGIGCGSNGTVWRVSPKGVETILHSFVGTTDGCYPYGGVVGDSHGHLYGNTSQCGANNGGTLWELSSSGFTVLHSFAGPDGLYPQGNLLLGPNGELYGTTHSGGTGGEGTVWSYVP